MSMHRKPSSFLFAALFAVTGLIFTSCGGDDGNGDPKPTESSYGVLSAKGSYSILVQVIDIAGLKSAFDGSTKYTFFAPDNDAMLAAGVDVTSMTEQEAKDLINYHMSNGVQTLESMPADGYISSNLTENSSGRKLSIYINTKDGSIRANGFVVAGSEETTTGIIHWIVDAMTPLTIKGHLDVNPNTELYGLATGMEASIRDRLTGSGQEHTVFASNQTSFTAYLNSQNKSLFNLPPTLRRALLNNTIIEDAAKFKAELSATETTLGKDLSTSGGGSTIAGDISVTQGNIQCTNGVIHIVNGVIPD